LNVLICEQLNNVTIVCICYTDSCLLVTVGNYDIFAVLSVLLTYCVLLEKVGLLAIQPNSGSFMEHFYTLILCITSSVLFHVSLFFPFVWCLQD